MRVPYKTLLAVGCFSFAASPLLVAQTATTASTDEKKDEAKEEQVVISEDSIVGKMATTVGQYFSAKSPKERLSFILDPEKNEPLMRDFYFREAYIPGGLSAITVPQAVAVGGLAFWKTNFTLKDGRQGTVFLRLVDNQPKVDWPSQVNYSPVKWDDWLKEKADKPVDFRVMAQIDNYYPKAYSDRTKYICVKVSNMESPSTVFAYLNIADPDQLEFAQMLANSQGQPKDCVLTLKLDKNADEIQTATVEKVVSPSWLIIGGGK